MVVMVCTLRGVNTDPVSRPIDVLCGMDDDDGAAHRVTTLLDWAAARTATATATHVGMVSVGDEGTDGGCWRTTLCSAGGDPKELAIGEADTGCNMSSSPAAAARKRTSVQS